MNIGLITFSLSDRSGARAPIRLAQFLQREGHLVHLYAYDIGLNLELKNQLEQEGLVVTIYETNPKLPFPLIGLAKLLKMITDLKAGDHEIISFHSNLLALWAAKLSGRKILATYYGTEFSYRKIRGEAKMPINPGWVTNLKSTLNDSLLTLLQRIYFWLAGDAVAISRFLAVEADKFFNKKLKVIYLGAETDFFKPNTKVTESDFILSVSRIVPYKGFDLLIEAFKKVNEKNPNLRLVIVGSVANTQYLTYLKSISNPRVEIRSNLSDQELQRLYASCLFYATCDLWVPWSLTPLEASFFGKPLLALNLGAMKEIIKDGSNGLLAGDTTDLVSKMARLVTDRTLRERLGQGASKLVTNFDWSKTAREYSQAFRDKTSD